jgi:hypothetical protein
VARQPKLSEADFPPPGSVFVAPTTDGRLAAGRVLRRQYEGGAVGALVSACRWLGMAIPDIDSPELRENLVLTHHSWQGRREIFWTHTPLPANFQIVGQIDLTEEDLASCSNVFTDWRSVPLQALLQWRWDNDRAALLKEEAEQAIATAERQRKIAATRAEYLKTLTLESLKAKLWFESWTTGEPARPLNQSRSLLTQLVDDLLAHPKLTKPAARKRFKQCVEAFNVLDTIQPFIETIERDALYEAFEQISCASGFPQLVDEVDKWRDW